MRIIFTIIFNGLHHLEHNNQAEFIKNNCDYWVVVEGASSSNGSTRWCKSIPNHLHNNGKSVDGTAEFLKDFSNKNKNIIYIESEGFWNSKDVQVNRAIEEIKKITNECYLWEFDIDEQWESDSLDQAEIHLDQQNAKTGRFRADCYVGKDILAKGDWGELHNDGYVRLWKWNGEYFKTHEPPILEGNNDPSILLNQRFKHYNYYFEKDVMFKNDWYGGHEGIYERWKLINSLPKQNFPLPINYLITGPWGRSNTILVKV
jgi:hypothetical protein